jgi:hypothetical protein
MLGLAMRWLDQFTFHFNDLAQLFFEPIRFHRCVAQSVDRALLSTPLRLVQPSLTDGKKSVAIPQGLAFSIVPSKVQDCCTTLREKYVGAAVCSFIR